MIIKNNHKNFKKFKNSKLSEIKKTINIIKMQTKIFQQIKIFIIVLKNLKRKIKKYKFKIMLQDTMLHRVIVENLLLIFKKNSNKNITYKIYTKKI